MASSSVGETVAYQLTPRDIICLTWIAMQYAIRLDQLQRLLYRYTPEQDRYKRKWTAHWRRQYVEVLPLAQTESEAKPPPRPPRAVRSRQSFRWQDRLACNAGLGPPQLRVSVTGVPAFLALN